MGKVKNLLKRFIKGTASDEDAQKVETWLDGAISGKDPWKELNEDDRISFLMDLKSKIDHSKKQTKKNGKGHNRYMWFGAAAVIILLMIPVYVLWKRTPGESNSKVAVQQIVETKIAEIKQVALSDGSMVWLNAKSRLRYTDSFNTHTREVYLDGQAYFEIKRDVKRPFIVHASSWKVSVLGTHFDVSDYLEDSDVTVSVLSGKVSVKPNAVQSAPVIIHPGETLMYDKETRELNKGKFAVSPRPEWINSEVVFYHTKMGEVANFIKRTYGFTLSFSAPELTSMEVSGDFGEIKNVKELLELICLTINCQYKMKGKNIEIIHKH